MKILHKSEKVSALSGMRDDILLDPAWQRGAVWTKQKKALLIDSIIREYDIPKLYLRSISPGGAHKFEVVDGQQRLRAIWDYLDGSYCLANDAEDIGDQEIRGKSFSQLSARLRNKILNFKIVVAYVENAQEPELSVLFARMQMGVALNPAELRNAIQCPIRHLIDSIAREHDFFSNSKISAARFKHQDYLAHAFCSCYYAGGVHLKAPQLKAMYGTDFESEEILDLAANATKILDCMNSINLKTKSRIVQKWIFVDIFYYLYNNKEKLNNLNVDNFSSLYLEFDRERLQNNQNPENLLQDSVSASDKALYSYIIHFKSEGARRESLLARNLTIVHRFGGAWG